MKITKQIWELLFIERMTHDENKDIYTHENYELLDKDNLIPCIRENLKVYLRKHLFYLFQHRIKDNKSKLWFNYIYDKTQNILDYKIKSLDNMTKKQMLVWCLSIMMCIIVFKDGVETKYTLKDNQKIISLFQDIFDTSFYKFVEYNKL